MKRLSLEEARDKIGDWTQRSYSDCELADGWGGLVLLTGRVSHCGGTEKMWFGLVTPQDADALEREGLADGWRRSRVVATETASSN